MLMKYSAKLSVLLWVLFFTVYEVSVDVVVEVL